jgi:hypothetical protein
MKTQQTTISEVRLVYRTKVKTSDRLQVKCSRDAFDIFMENWDLDSIEHIEEFKLMLLTTFGWSDFTLHTYLNNNHLTPARDVQFIPANYGQGHWLFH